MNETLKGYRHDSQWRSDQLVEYPLPYFLPISEYLRSNAPLDRPNHQQRK